MIHKALEKLVDEVEVKLPNKLPCPLAMKLKARAARQVDHDPRKGLIERHIGVPVAAYGLLGSYCLGKGLTNGDANVFHCMVGVNFKVPFGLDLEVDKAMTRDLIKHVIKKRDAGIKLLLTGSVEVQAHNDLGLGRITAQFGDSHGAMIQFGA